MRAPGPVSILIVCPGHAAEIDACLDGALAQAGEGSAAPYRGRREDPREVRGTLGGRGLTGGPPPLTPVARRGARR